MENEVYIDPNNEQNEPADKQHITRHLTDEMTAFLMVLIFDSASELRRSDSGYRAVRNTDHHRHIGCDGEDTGVIQTHLRRHKERRQSRR